MGVYVRNEEGIWRDGKGAGVFPWRKDGGCRNFGVVVRGGEGVARMVLLVVVRVLNVETAAWGANIEIPVFVIEIDSPEQVSRHLLHRELLEQDLSLGVIPLLLSVVYLVPYPFPHQSFLVDSVRETMAVVPLENHRPE